MSLSVYRLNRAAEAVRWRGNDGRLSMGIGIVGSGKMGGLVGTLWSRAGRGCTCGSGCRG